MSADIYFKVYHFPKSIESVRRRVRKLEKRARELGLTDRANELEAVNEAWDLAIESARLEHREAGDKYSIGVDSV